MCNNRNASIKSCSSMGIGVITQKFEGRAFSDELSGYSIHSTEWVHSVEASFAPSPFATP